MRDASVRREITRTEEEAARTESIARLVAAVT